MKFLRFFGMSRAEQAAELAKVTAERDAALAELAAIRRARSDATRRGNATRRQQFMAKARELQAECAQQMVEF